MRKVVFIFRRILWIGIFLTSTLSGAPTSTGTSGLVRIVSASSEPFGKLDYTFGIRGYWTTSLDSLVVYDQFGGLHEGTKWQCAGSDFSIGLGFSFTDYLSLNLNSGFLTDVMQTDIPWGGAGAVSWGLSDTKLGIKFTPTQAIRLVYPKFTKVIDLGIYPIASFPTGTKRISPPNVCGTDTIFGYACRLGNGGIHRFFTVGGATYGGSGLLTVNILTQPQIKFHLNGGYINYPHPDSYNKYTYGAGIELNYFKLSSFVEAYGEKRVKPEYNDGGLYLSPGLRFETEKNTWLTISMDFRLMGYDTGFVDDDLKVQRGFGTTPPWAVNLTFSQSFDFVKPPVNRGIIAGRVVDKVSEKPIRAIISFPGFDTTITTDEQGIYEIELPVGQTLVYASPMQKETYEPSQEVIILVEQEKRVVVNFRLERKKVYVSILTGKIIDKVTQKPCLATISFPETELPEVKSDASGIYKTELLPGTYILRIEKTGYIPWTQPVICKPEETTLLNIELSPVERKSILIGKIVDYSTRRGIEAEIEFQGTDIPPVKSDPETGTYRVEIPSGTYNIKIKAEGYVVEGAAIVCNPDASLIKNFELFKIEEKIILGGITFEFNKANIKPTSYKMLDEAVELLKKHPNIKIEIAGHTSSEGSDTYNLKLSQLRAEAVKEYLVTHGISVDRLQARGYGETQPIASNRTEKGRAKNRRIEFRILSE
ncbi:MAG: OmpA family protein [bacterium]|nr:OmpA family protein [bacterium]